MCTFIPIVLTANTLGQRHRQFNSLVNEVYKSGLPFQNVETVPEKSPIDRLFKIDLASKLKNVDYILQNIKDEDLLYMSRALKCKWLLDTKYENIINPRNLENVLFPHMITPAVSKFKNWLYVHLKDPQRCEEFYRYYAEQNIAYAIKFLSGCNNIFVVTETEKILDKLSPRQLKILCEKCPKVAELYFANITTNDTLKNIFLDKVNEYYKSLKVVLKQDPDMFFDISEKYFENRFNKPLTKYILTHHKHKFNTKIELYTTRLLHMEMVAECLSSEECKEIILQLARAKYLSNWFSYKNVEPLVKRLSVNERAEFKKRVFLDRDIGEEIEEWPYELPSFPAKEHTTIHVFDDMECMPYKYECLEGKTTKRLIKKKMCSKFEHCFIYSTGGGTKTYLDKLFDEYRFTSFGRTLFELRRRIKVESLPQNREYILLVLVSKSGGKTENLSCLLELLSQHSNEPVHVRAAIVRSLVKRAAVWRLPQETWEAFLEFGRELGLDGSTSKCECREGLHAVILRNLLESGNCEPKIREAFMEQFSQLDEYPTNVNERKVLKVSLPLLVLNAVECEINTEKQALLLQLLLDTFKVYKVPIETSPLISAVATLAKRDFSAANYLLSRLYTAKIARRTLFHENFSFIQTDSSYLNALRHDKSVIDVNIFLDLIIEGNIYPKMFLRKVSIYYSESGGLMETYLGEMKKRVLTLTQPSVKLAKSLCLLLGADMTYICGLNVKEKHIERFAAELRANMHTGRTKLDMSELNLSVIGAKGVANKVLVCRDTEVDNYVKILFKWKRTVMLGVVLAQRIGKEADAFIAAASIRPTASLKTAIKYFRRKGNSFDTRVWDAVKPVLQNIDFSIKERQYLCNFISEVNNIPSSIRPEYCTILYIRFINSSYYKGLSILCHIELQLPNVCEEFVENVLTDFLNEMNSDDKYVNKNIACTLLYVRIVIKYLLFAKSQDVQRKRFEAFAEKLLGNLESMRNNERFEMIFEEILSTLQNNKSFFDSNIVSPLFVMEKIVSWMHKHFPMELHFCKYVYIHLTMLYCKAIRQSVIQMPLVFNNEKRKRSEGIDIIGRTFGKYIAHEVKILMTKYFSTIIEIYRIHISTYFEKYFQYDATVSRFTVAVIKGILDGSKGTELKVGIYLLKDKWHNIGNTLSFQLANEMKKIEDLETKFFVFGEFCS